MIIHQQGWIVPGLLDDDPAKRGARIGDVPVLGAPSDLTRLDLLREATHVIVALPGATASQRRRAIELAATSDLPVLTVPSVSELLDGSARIERVRGIEPEDGGAGDERLLKTREPACVVDLARDMILLSGHREREIVIVFSDVRPAESCVRSCWPIPSRPSPLRTPDCASRS